jgi:pyruvate dehydrogenase E1 component beta subunit
MSAAALLAKEGIHIELIDPRTLVPFDTDLVLASVRKTGRLVIVEESNQRGGWGAQLAADVACQAIESLDAPIVRVAAPDVPVPFSPPLELAVIPQEDDIVRAVRDVLTGVRR